MNILCIEIALLAALGAAPESDEIRLRGTVGDRPIRVAVRRFIPRPGQREQLDGWYIYEKYFLPIPICGAISGASAELEEGYCGGGLHPPLAKIRIRLLADSFEGEWTSADGKRHLPFRATRDEDPHSPPADWLVFRRSRFPIEFRYPRTWPSRQVPGGLTLASPAPPEPNAVNFVEDVRISFGTGRPSSVYLRRKGAWVIPGTPIVAATPSVTETEDTPASPPIRMNGVEIRRDEIDCKTPIREGGAAEGTCAVALVLAGKHWLSIYATHNGEVVDTILHSMRVIDIATPAPHR